MMSRGMSSALSIWGLGSGRSTETSSPPFSRSPALVFFPFTRARPSSISPFTAERVRALSESVRNRSSLLGASSSATRNVRVSAIRGDNRVKGAGKGGERGVYHISDFMSPFLLMSMSTIALLYRLFFLSMAGSILLL